MTNKPLLALTAAILIASTAWADSVQRKNEATDENTTNRIPGSVKLEDKPMPIPSFEPMPPPRQPCPRMVIESQTVRAPVYYSMERMPERREPVVACGPLAATERVAVLEPAPAPVAPPPEPEPPPVQVVQHQPPPPPPVVTELPHTGSILPLIGLVGMLLLAGSGVVRGIRALMS